MLRLKSKITFNDTQIIEPLDFVNNVEIVSSWETFTDTATITLPFKLKIDGKFVAVGDTANTVFKRGDKVKIELGYVPNLTTIFEGYISSVGTDSPLVLQCQDASYLLKQKTITKSFKSTTLANLLNEVVTEIDTRAVDAELGAFRLTRVNVIQVLDEIKKTYGLASFIRGGVLRSGLAYYPDEATENEFSFQSNILTGSSLEFQRAEDVKIKVKAISIQPDNTKIEVEEGEEGGATRTLFAYNVTNESDLKKFAKAELEKFNFDGYRGEFETFGEPVVKHGDFVNIKDAKFKEREGRYVVDQVTTTFGVDGYRQKIKLGERN